ncbi:hypothetical protein [Paenibacillus luteus]|uniref:hypothetical protein n=1 Tax=Paenibacillus luteus TaxID=2545753 RepID=UPI001144A9B3|nr:hypothetical protein [Paenibacillus luteus]
MVIIVGISRLITSNYSEEEMVYMKKAEELMENALHEEITVTDMYNVKIYGGPVVVEGYIDRFKEIFFSISTDKDLTGFQNISTLYYAILNEDAEKILSPIIQQFFGQNASSNPTVNVGNVSMKDQYLSYNELLSSNQAQLSYSIRVTAQSQVEENDITNEANRLFELLNELKSKHYVMRSVRIQNLNIDITFDVDEYFENISLSEGEFNIDTVEAEFERRLKNNREKDVQ